MEVEFVPNEQLNKMFHLGSNHEEEDRVIAEAKKHEQKSEKLIAKAKAVGKHYGE